MTAPDKLSGFEEWFDKTFKKDFTFRDGCYSWAKAGWEAALQNQHKHSGDSIGSPVKYTDGTYSREYEEPAKTSGKSDG